MKEMGYEKTKNLGLICATMSEYKATAEMIPWEDLQSDPVGFKVKKSVLDGRNLFLTVSGIGKAAAAAATQNMICRFMPDIIISFGTAGSLEEQTKAGTVIVPLKIIQGDMGVHDPLGFHHIGVSLQLEGKITLAKYLNVPEKLARWSMETLESRGMSYSTGTLLTCDQIVLSRTKRWELHQQFGVVAVDMESSAVAQVAETNGIPCLVVRAISDEVDLEICNLHKMMVYRDDPPGDKITDYIKDGKILSTLARFYQQMQLAYTNMAKALHLLISKLPDEIL